MQLWNKLQVFYKCQLLCWHACVCAYVSFHSRILVCYEERDPVASVLLSSSHMTLSFYVCPYGYYVGYRDLTQGWQEGMPLLTIHLSHKQVSVPSHSHSIKFNLIVLYWASPISKTLLGTLEDSSLKNRCCLFWGNSRTSREKSSHIARIQSEKVMKKMWEEFQKHWRD